MIMKTILLILTVFGIASSGYAQDMKHIDATYFILGTLSDYNGRFRSIQKENQVDRYNSYEKPAIDFINELSHNELKIKVTCAIDSGSTTLEYETFSKDLASILNSFYGKDKYLLMESFKDPVQIYSFLAGKYYRYGSRLNDKIYEFRFLNFPNHFICNDLLKRIGCKVYFRNIEQVPAQYIYYFVPTKELERYFEMISPQKEILNNSYNTFYKRLWGVDEEQYNRIRTDLNKKELLEIGTKLL